MANVRRGRLHLEAAAAQLYADGYVYNPEYNINHPQKLLNPLQLTEEVPDVTESARLYLAKKKEDGAEAEHNAPASKGGAVHSPSRKGEEGSVKATRTTTTAAEGDAHRHHQNQLNNQLSSRYLRVAEANTSATAHFYIPHLRCHNGSEGHVRSYGASTIVEGAYRSNRPPPPPPQVVSNTTTTTTEEKEHSTSAALFSLKKDKDKDQPESSPNAQMEPLSMIKTATKTVTTATAAAYIHPLPFTPLPSEAREALWEKGIVNHRSSYGYDKWIAAEAYIEEENALKEAEERERELEEKMRRRAHRQRGGSSSFTFEFGTLRQGVGVGASVVSGSGGNFEAAEVASAAGWSEVDTQSISNTDHISVSGGGGGSLSRSTLLLPRQQEQKQRRLGGGGGSDVSATVLRGGDGGRGGETIGSMSVSSFGGGHNGKAPKAIDVRSQVRSRTKRAREEEGSLLTSAALLSLAEAQSAGGRGDGAVPNSLFGWQSQEDPSMLLAGAPSPGILSSSPSLMPSSAASPAFDGSFLPPPPLPPATSASPSSPPVGATVAGGEGGENELAGLSRRELKNRLKELAHKQKQQQITFAASPSTNSSSAPATTALLAGAAAVQITKKKGETLDKAGVGVSTAKEEEAEEEVKRVRQDEGDDTANTNGGMVMIAENLRAASEVSSVGALAGDTSDRSHGGGEGAEGGGGGEGKAGGPTDNIAKKEEDLSPSLPPLPSLHHEETVATAGTKPARSEGGSSLSPNVVPQSSAALLTSSSVTVANYQSIDSGDPSAVRGEHTTMYVSSYGPASVACGMYQKGRAHRQRAEIVLPRTPHHQHHQYKPLVDSSAASRTTSEGVGTHDVLGREGDGKEAHVVAASSAAAVAIASTSTSDLLIKSLPPPPNPNTLTQLMYLEKMLATYRLVLNEANGILMGSGPLKERSALLAKVDLALSPQLNSYIATLTSAVRSAEVELEKIMEENGARGGGINNKATANGRHTKGGMLGDEEEEDERRKRSGGGVGEEVPRGPSPSEYSSSTANFLDDDDLIGSASRERARALQLHYTLLKQQLEKLCAERDSAIRAVASFSLEHASSAAARGGSRAIGLGLGVGGPNNTSREDELSALLLEGEGIGLMSLDGVPLPSSYSSSSSTTTAAANASALAALALNSSGGSAAGCTSQFGNGSLGSGPSALALSSATATTAASSSSSRVRTRPKNLSTTATTATGAASAEEISTSVGEAPVDGAASIETTAASTSPTVLSFPLPLPTLFARPAPVDIILAEDEANKFVRFSFSSAKAFGLRRDVADPFNFLQEKSRKARELLRKSYTQQQRSARTQIAQNVATIVRKYLSEANSSPSNTSNNNNTSLIAAGALPRETAERSRRRQQGISIRGDGSINAADDAENDDEDDDVDFEEDDEEPDDDDEAHPSNHEEEDAGRGGDADEEEEERKGNTAAVHRAKTTKQKKSVLKTKVNPSMVKSARKAVGGTTTKGGAGTASKRKKVVHDDTSGEGVKNANTTTTTSAMLSSSPRARNSRTANATKLISSSSSTRRAAARAATVVARSSTSRSPTDYLNLASPPPSSSLPLGGGEGEGEGKGTGGGGGGGGGGGEDSRRLVGTLLRRERELRASAAAAAATASAGGRVLMSSSSIRVRTRRSALKEEKDKEGEAEKKE